MPIVRVSERDLCAVARQGGWTADFLPPPREKIAALVQELPGFSPAKRDALVVVLLEIFPGLLRHLSSAGELDSSGKMMATGRKELRGIAETSATLRRKVGEMHEPTRIALELVQGAQCALVGGTAAFTLQNLLTNLFEDINQLDALIDRTVLESPPGPYAPLADEFVENLLAHYVGVVGRIPGRSYREHVRGGPPGGAGGAFLYLCRNLYALAIEQLPIHQRPPRLPRLTGIVEKKLREAKQKRRLDGECRDPDRPFSDLCI